MTAPARRFAAILLAAVLILGAVFHWRFWYSPRPRPGVPDARGKAAALCAEGGYELCLWLPFPHQNLGALAASAGDLDGFLAAAARRGGFAPPRLPAFGPFAAPPAREMSLAADRDGKRFAAVARLYPTMALVARLAGRVAGNPWLAGGEVEVGRRPGRVRWEGRLWILESVEATTGQAAAPGAGGLPGGGPPGEAALPRLSLAQLSLSVPLDPVPAGRYRLVATAAGLTIEGGGLGGPAAPALLSVPSVAAVTLDAAHEPARAAALFVGEQVKTPRAAVLFRGPGKRWKLPGESLLTFGGRKMPQGERAGWGFVTYDHASLELAAPLAEELAALVPTAGPPKVARGLWFRPRETRQVVRQVADLLEAIPLFGQDEAERWQDYATLLAPLSRFSTCAVELGTGAGAVRVELSR